MNIYVFEVEESLFSDEMGLKKIFLRYHPPGITLEYTSQGEEKKKEIEKKYGEYKKSNEKFLEDNKNKEGINVTPAGLQYEVIKNGKGESPTKTSKVKVHYHGTLVDGTVFDSSVDRGTPSEFGVGRVIKGWTEGLQLMKPGAKYKFYIPQELAYGAQERGEKIKPYSTLIFDVELIEVK